jgi:hypothetical protein
MSSATDSKLIKISLEIRLMDQLENTGPTGLAVRFRIPRGEWSSLLGPIASEDAWGWRRILWGAAMPPPQALRNERQRSSGAFAI